jgi:hypothetical protein
VTGDLVHLKVKDVKTIEELPKLTEKTLGKRKKPDGEEEEEEGMWYKKSILWELEYWTMLDACHSIDNMHVKKNVCEATCVISNGHKPVTFLRSFVTLDR